MPKFKIVLIGVLLIIPSMVFAQSPSKCEEQLALSNQLLQDFAQDRGRVQVEAAALKVQIETLKKEMTEMKLKAEVKGAKK
jgi:hypothetical protein